MAYRSLPGKHLGKNLIKPAKGGEAFQWQKSVQVELFPQNFNESTKICPRLFGILRENGPMKREDLKKLAISKGIEIKNAKHFKQCIRHLLSTKKVKCYPHPEKRSMFVYGEVNPLKDYKFNPYNYPKDAETTIKYTQYLEKQKELKKTKENNKEETTSSILAEIRAQAEKESNDIVDGVNNENQKQ